MSKNNVSEIQIENDTYRIDYKVSSGLQCRSWIGFYQTILFKFIKFLRILRIFVETGLENLDECQTEIFLTTYQADGVAFKKET